MIVAKSREVLFSEAGFCRIPTFRESRLSGVGIHEQAVDTLVVDCYLEVRVGQAAGELLTCAPPSRPYA